MPKEKDAPTLEQLDSLVDQEPHDTVADLLREEMDAAAKGAEDPPVDPEDPPKEDDDHSADDADDGKDADDPDKGAKAGSDDDPDKDEDKEIDPPADWSADEHEKFRKLDADSRKWVLERVSGSDKAVTEAKQTAAKYEALEKVIAPYRDAWARDGMTEDQAIRQLTSLSTYAATKPAEFLQWFAQQRGINLAELASAATAQPGEQDPDTDDPVVLAVRRENAALRKHIEDLGGRVDKVASTFEDRQQQEQFFNQQRAQTEIQKFAEEKGDDGSLKHPHFNQLTTEIGIYLSNGLAENLQEAYDRACRANPDVWAKIEMSRKATESREQAKRDRGKAAAASKAGSSVTGQPGARSEPTFTGDLHEDLRSEFAERGLT